MYCTVMTARVPNYITVLYTETILLILFMTTNVGLTVTLVFSCHVTVQAHVGPGYIQTSTTAIEVHLYTYTMATIQVVLDNELLQILLVL